MLNERQYLALMFSCRSITLKRISLLIEKVLKPTFVNPSLSFPLPEILGPIGFRQEVIYIVRLIKRSSNSRLNLGYLARRFPLE